MLCRCVGWGLIWDMHMVLPVFGGAGAANQISEVKCGMQVRRCVCAVGAEVGWGIVLLLCWVIAGVANQNSEVKRGTERRRCVCAVGVRG
jgi:hypothetical protein